MATNKIIPFKITRMDSLGQGVSKETDKVTFIPKTSIGDAGEAEVLSERKGVAFARVRSFTEKSVDRIEPLCTHFSQCPSCHYLHLNYELELRHKTSSLENLFHRLEPPLIEAIGAPRRTGYRNRIQLHYNARDRKLGMIDARSGNITPIPACIIALPEILEEVKRLYQNDTWLKEVPKGSSHGHLEIYFKEGEVSLTWNRPYAEGGFTQVFEEMNKLMKERVAKWYKGLEQPSDLVDLFAGNGNLSNDLQTAKRLCVDVYPQVVHPPFYSQNLYAENALKKVLQQLKELKIDPKTLLLDPPRSGMKDLDVWLEKINPRFVAYVSCDPHTLVRDLGRLKDYKITSLVLMDFFPSTFHFETLAFLERKA